LVCGKESFVLINYKCKKCNAKNFKKNQKIPKIPKKKTIYVPKLGTPVDESLLYVSSTRSEYFRRKYGGKN